MKLLKLELVERVCSPWPLKLTVSRFTTLAASVQLPWREMDAPWPSTVPLKFSKLPERVKGVIPAVNFKVPEPE